MESPTRRSNRIKGQEPNADHITSSPNTIRELKSLQCSGGSGGRMTLSDNNWSFDSKHDRTISPAEHHNNHDNSLIPMDMDCEQTPITEESTNNNKYDNTYQMINVPRLEDWVNNNCVCRCQLRHEIRRFTRHCATFDNQITSDELDEIATNWQANVKPKRTLSVNVHNMGIEPNITMHCSYCNKEQQLPNDTTKFCRYNYNGELTAKTNCSWFSSNLRLVMGTLASDMGGTEIAKLCSFIGLASLHSFSSKAYKKTKH